MKNNNVSWKVLKDDGHIRDSLLYIKVSVLAQSMLKAGCTINQIESTLQNAGMNIEYWQIQLILARKQEVKSSQSNLL